MSALAQPPWGPNPAKPEFTIQRSSGRRVSGICWVQWALQWHSCPGMLLHDTQGAWASGGYPEQGGQSRLHYPLTRQEAANGKVSRSSLRTNGELLGSSRPQLHKTTQWVKPRSAPLHHCDHRPKCAVQSHQAVSPRDWWLIATITCINIPCLLYPFICQWT